jgi:hypothetical protein
LLPGRVEQVEYTVSILKLQHHTGDRDATLALHIHPVGGDSLSALTPHAPHGAFDRAGLAQKLSDRVVFPASG